MEREELLKSPEFWMLEIQMNLLNQINEYIETNNISRKQLADKLGFSKGYITQILNGDFDHRISKLVQLSLSIGKVPRINFEDIEQVLFDDLQDKLHAPKYERPEIKLNFGNSLKIEQSGRINSSGSDYIDFNIKDKLNQVKYAEETTIA